MQLSTWNLYKDEATAPRKQWQSQKHGTDSLKNLYHQNVVEMVDLIRHHDIYVCVVQGFQIKDTFCWICVLL